MTTSVSDALVERVAKAIEGPHQPLPPHSATHLGVLRNIRWRNLTTDERQMRLNEARAAIAAIPPEGRLRDALLAGTLSVSSFPGPAYVVRIDFETRAEADELAALLAALQGDSQ